MFIEAHKLCYDITNVKVPKPMVSSTMAKHDYYYLFSSNALNSIRIVIICGSPVSGVWFRVVCVCLCKSTDDGLTECLQKHHQTEKVREASVMKMTQLVSGRYFDIYIYLLYSRSYFPPSFQPQPLHHYFTHTHTNNIYWFRWHKCTRDNKMEGKRYNKNIYSCVYSMRVAHIVAKSVFTLPSFSIRIALWRPTVDVCLAACTLKARMDIVNLHCGDGTLK